MDVLIGELYRLDPVRDWDGRLRKCNRNVIPGLPSVTARLFLV